jgi:hypothetical protein
MEHLPKGFTFGIKCKQDSLGVCELVGYSKPKNPDPKVTENLKMLPAGRKTHHADDLEQQKHIVPILGRLEDKKLVLKITEDVLGGRPKKLDLTKVYGLPTVRDYSNRSVPRSKGLTDQTNYGDELSAKGSII